MKDTTQGIMSMNKEIERRSKVVNKKEKHRAKKEREHVQVALKVDTLELDNYLLREHISNILNLTDEQKDVVD
jgi:hypothetical protein